MQSLEIALFCWVYGKVTWHFSYTSLEKQVSVLCVGNTTHNGEGLSGTEVSGKLTWRWGPGMARGAGGVEPQGRINPQASQ